jgi:hypothetical protein
VSDQSLGGDPGHEFIPSVGALAAIKPEGEGDGLFDIIDGGRRKGRLVGLDNIEQIKNINDRPRRTSPCYPVVVA